MTLTFHPQWWCWKGGCGDGISLPLMCVYSKKRTGLEKGLSGAQQGAHQCFTRKNRKLGDALNVPNKQLIIWIRVCLYNRTSCQRSKMITKVQTWWLEHVFTKYFPDKSQLLRSTTSSVVLHVYLYLDIYSYAESSQNGYKKWNVRMVIPVFQSLGIFLFSFL